MTVSDGESGVASAGAGSDAAHVIGVAKEQRSTMRNQLFSFVVVLGVAWSVASPRANAAPAELDRLQQQLHSFGQRPMYEGPPLTLQAALSEALEHNPELIALRKQFEAAKFRPAQERFLMAPTFEATIWQWPLNTLNPANTNMYMFMLNQDLPGRGKRELRASVAQKGVDLAENEIAVRARQVIDEVKRAYADLFVNRKAIDVHLANVDLLRQFADVSQAKYETGRISQQDVLKAVVEVAKLHDDLIVMDLQAKVAAARLNRLLNRPIGAAVGPLEEPHERMLLPAVEVLEDLALKNQPELRTAQIDIERSQAELAVAKRDYKPDFSVQGGYLLMPGQTDSLLVRVGVTWPTAPWARGKLDARVAEATASVDAAKAGEASVENALRFAVQEAYLRVKAAEQRAALLRSTIVPQSQQTLEVSRVAYQTDRVDFLALIDNQRVLLNAQLDYFKALSDQEQAIADLERAVGTEMPPAMLTASRRVE